MFDTFISFFFLKKKIKFNLRYLKTSNYLNLNLVDGLFFLPFFIKK